MASKDLKHRVRSSILNWKLSIKTAGKSDELFIDNVFRELGTIMESVFSKHDGSLPQNRKECHQIIDIYRMTSRILARIYEAVLRRLRSTPTTASPYFCTFKEDVPREVFDVILKGIIEQNSFGHSCSATNSTYTVLITDRRKANYIMSRMDETSDVDKSKLFCKEFEDKGVAKVLFSKEKPFTFKYAVKRELLTISFNYGYWNSFGIPQH